MRNDFFKNLLVLQQLVEVSILCSLQTMLGDRQSSKGSRCFRQMLPAKGFKDGKMAKSEGEERRKEVKDRNSCKSWKQSRMPDFRFCLLYCASFFQLSASVNLTRFRAAHAQMDKILICILQLYVSCRPTNGKKSFLASNIALRPWFQTVSATM